MFKKIILPAVAATALSAVAVPAMANHDHRGWDRVERRLERIDRQIDQGVRSGQITRHEAVRLRGEFRQLVQLERRYAWTGGGLDRREMADLDWRFDRLQAQVRYERRDRQRAGYGYDRRYDRRYDPRYRQRSGVGVTFSLGGW